MSHQQLLASSAFLWGEHHTLQRAEASSRSSGLRMDLGRGQVDIPLGLSLTVGTGEKDIRVVSEMWVDNFASSVSSTGV